MGITERKEREKVEMRRKILDAARDLFAREGYEQVTMRRIAEAIEYSATTIYNHFEDKDDLVKALCEEDFTRLLGALSSASLPDDPVEQIRQLGRAYASFGLEWPNHYRFMFLTPNKTHDLDRESPGHRSFGLLRSVVERAVTEGRFRKVDPDLATQVLWSNLHGVVSLLITMQPQHWPAPPAPDLVEQVIEYGIRGFLKEE
jgi:AcrR family transcriptional regulator